MQILGTVLNLKRYIKHSNMVQGKVLGTGPSLQEKQNKATRDQIRRAQRLGEDLNMIRLEAPVPSIGTMPMCQSNDKVCRNKRRKVPTGLTRSKSFIDRLQTAKQEQEELKIKSVDFSKAHRR